ncbi:permeases of the major facilitator superfamily [Stylonychia lemnae]|uniref:Permeases of the major facilitator superfamily n=1 Tax=Stylonychia lemnae TaxID=5949 RepID=A0A078AXZ8_STYLE|nr:permeases of the major facilitator superfamily [Stylonychia lemnae]|eukprot:CDW87310.1 permeases of the major facilitator superfamily [Stylonychia lemnae]
MSGCTVNQSLMSKKTRVLIQLMFSITIPQLLYLNIATFLPQYRSLNHISIGDGMIGIILSQEYFISLTDDTRMFQFSFLVVSLIIGYSIICNEFKEEREKYIGFIQTSAGLGIMAGPFIGQMIYNEVGFQLTFLYFSLIILIAVQMASQLEIEEEQQIFIVRNYEDAENQQMETFLANDQVLFHDSCLADHLINDQAVGSHSVALFMFGPSKIFNLGDNLTLSVIGVGILGCTLAMNYQIKQKEGIQDSEQLNDLAASINSATYGLGAVFAPIVGGFLYQFVGFQYACDILGCISFAYGTFYLFIRIIPELKQSKQDGAREQQLKQKNFEVQKIKPSWNELGQTNINIELIIKSRSNSDVPTIADDQNFSLSNLLS